MNLQKLMQQAQSMQKKVNEMQEKVGQMEITGTAGGGMVNVTITGKGEAKKVAIDPKIIDPNDKEMLEDLVVAAFNDAKRKADETMQKEMSGITSGMGLPPGFKMPF
ncbi:MAG: YbaB/EbfC family nucleoid-associated protein [Proteobacteria bacterium]|nr:YbaB/EbfC family nucleoid-associated protein [Pseudomonadota bacterium]